MILKKRKLELQKMTQMQLDIELKDACRDDNLELVRYLLTSPELTTHADIHSDHDGALRYACMFGSLEIVKYLLTSSDLKELANIHTEYDSALRYTCMYGSLNIVKYLLTSPELTEHANIHAGQDVIFKNICNTNDKDFLQYFIFDYEIDKTKDIEHYLIENKRDDLLDIFNKRDFNNKLKENLIENHPQKKIINKL